MIGRLLIPTLLTLAVTAAQPPGEDVSRVSAGSRPRFGIYGFDTSGMDTSVAPGDDFYQYANGAWAKHTAIPADKSSFGILAMLEEVSADRTRKIIEEEVKKPESRIGRAYESFMETGSIERKGLASFGPWLDQVRRANSRAELPGLYADAMRLRIGIPFESSVRPDAKSPGRYIFILAQAGLGMPDRDYYLSSDPKLAEIRSRYSIHLARMLALGGEDDASARAQAILELETNFARVSWTPAQNRDDVKTYNKMTLAALGRRAPEFNFEAYLGKAGIKKSMPIIVSQPRVIGELAGIIAQAPLQVLKDQLLVRSLEAYAPILPATVDRENFAFFGTVLSGTPEQEPRWKRAIAFSIEALADDVGRLYSKRYFPPATKAAAHEIAVNVIAAMGRRIDRLTWMSAQTKRKAQAKVRAFTIGLGYPDHWRDLSKLSILPGDALGNAMRVRRFNHDYQMSKIGRPVEKWDWNLTPMDVNADAYFERVEMVFPAAILQPPFFDPNADSAVNYGAIGAAIGHELSHHFDDEGSKYDARGRLSEWWTIGDRRAFENRLGKLGRQYETYQPLPGIHVNGKLTMGENVADLAGLTVAHDAYLASLKGGRPPVIAGTTGDQRFFFGWAQIWRRNYREPNLRQRLLTDPHSPSEQRVSIVRNLDSWYSAFGINAGTALYLAPAERVRIW